MATIYKIEIKSPRSKKFVFHSTASSLALARKRKLNLTSFGNIARIKKFVSSSKVVK